jgi:hypothetical protein
LQYQPAATIPAQARKKKCPLQSEYENRVYLHLGQQQPIRHINGTGSGEFGYCPLPKGHAGSGDYCWI